MTERLCGCNATSQQCWGKVVLPPNDNFEFSFHTNWYVIVDGCPVGPRRNDTLVKAGNGWKIYQKGG